MSPETFNELKDEILRAIKSDSCADERNFNPLALRIHEFQRANNTFYRRYCELMELESLDSWRDIPAIPTSAFKRTAIRSFPETETKTYFQTSGTTEGESGRHYFSTLEIYEAAIRPNFQRCLFPGMDRMAMAILTPPPSEAPHSSLVHMMETVRSAFGTEESSYFLLNGALETDRLSPFLADCVKTGTPVFLLGTAFSFAFLLDELKHRSVSFSLPSGSRIMETGGFKGRTREIERPEFYTMLSSAFGIPQSRIVNEYGMTELSSQFYDDSLATGAPSRLKIIPSWTRVQTVNPLTGKPAAIGQPGLLRILDLANLGSVIGLQTEDVGIFHDAARFEVMGRVAAAPPRGCSLAAEAILAKSPTYG